MAQFTLYSHAGGPNGWTVAFLLKAFGRSYETKYLQFDTAEHKGEDFLKAQPEWPYPGLVDHRNHDYTIWESKAILLYLVEKYDKERKFTVGLSVEEQSILLRWLFFQASGMGAYFGQAAHFVLYAPAESKPYGVERYTKEVARVLGVLERVLKEKDWLVGGKVTIADVAFFSWAGFAFQAFLPKDLDGKAEFPSVWAWNERLAALPFIAEAVKERTELLAGGH